MSTADDTITATEDYTARFGRAMMKSAPSPLAVMERGEGARVWDVDGKSYLDFLAGIAVNSLGYAHPAMVRAVSEQVATLQHVSNYFATRPQIELAERLRRVSGAGETGRVYYGNSGAEALEAALKLARLTGRPRVLALKNAFHGRTMGSLSLTGKPALREAFEPLIPGIDHIDSTIEALERALGPDVGALVLEPIKGEAGVVDLPQGYLERARELTHRHGVLLILDEVQTGAGRTGDWFAFQHHGIRPDAIAIAKGIGSGFPIGALVTFDAASDLFAMGHHGSTFGGNPLATATANAVLEEIESADLVGNARRRGEQLREAVLGLGSPLITDVSGRGLLLGIGLTEPAAPRVATAALRHGLIINAASETRIRLAPPLIIGDDEIAEFLSLFTAALEDAA
ncbi:acetylornithine aminotransferase [Diaminobutyricimonas aerilata]|uniref:Acetylornithine aminotransferase n=1 Tax=Diaminobutyricimonas aerilata TaxID=1162967 RepID=A0A2M9CKR6_9MICO|nr:acetylornithine transaminase [Diaminobutyricimonas aerilata]PJJ72477.1 acetylornithine aminotransferase [Diaminobutyricimonas aerilata]